MPGRYVELDEDITEDDIRRENDDEDHEDDEQDGPGHADWERL